MASHLRRTPGLAGVLPLITAFVLCTAPMAEAQDPELLHPGLMLDEVVSGLELPTTMAFIGPDDFLVLEKLSGHVLRVTGGVVQGVVLDLAVNFASERGLLGIALHPDFPTNPGVYLYWTESSSGSDTNVLSETPLLGNRVDRFVWDGSMLTFDHNLIHIRAIQEDANQPPRGNHDGGVMTFGHDGKLYVFVGDLGRRGHLQNLPCGPTDTCPGPIVPDDQFGGPEPDDAHLSGVVLRLNDDGTAPADNPFFAAGAGMGGEVGANIQLIYSYGHRNSFGIAVHPRFGDVWIQENGDDSFSELNRLTPGQNGGWVQIMGPASRNNQFKDIELLFGNQDLQQLRWPPENIADSPEEALSSLFMLPGAQYSDPEFSWKWEVAPGGMGFVEGWRLGDEFRFDLFMGAATDNLEGGYLFKFDISTNGRRILSTDPRVRDRVADNLAKHEITESESFLIGRNFGVVTDITSGPDGNLYLVSLTRGAIYRISAVGDPEAPVGPSLALREAPAAFALASNHPNPFNPTTTITYALPDEVHVRLEVFDVMGRRVATLVDGVQSAGEQQVRFDASWLPSGLYLYRISAGSFVASRTMQLLK